MAAWCMPQQRAARRPLPQGHIWKAGWDMGRVHTVAGSSPL
jgi:hypothetical protein